MNTTLINKINQAIHGNRCREITAPVLNSVLKDMVNKQVAEVTYAELATFITEQKVTPGITYKIKDRGDLGIFVIGLTKNTVSKDGIRLMLCPATYATTGDWIGVWSPGKSVSVGSKAIWGGKVWRNLTGSIGTPLEDTGLDTTNWQLVTKDSFTDDEYVPLQFGVSYDFANDWVERQWDGGGNIFGTTYNENIILEYSFNPCDISDWNLGTIPESLFVENQCTGVWNNSNSDISYNFCLFSPIRNNSNNGSITANKIMGGGISNNSNEGGIAANMGGAIHDNSNTGSIGRNVVSGSLSTNSNAGGIFYNFCYMISGNSNEGDILKNRALELIANSTAGFINNNANTGKIQTNQNAGNISHNCNNGDITQNTSSVENIQYNTNNGSIHMSTTVGDITDTIVDK